MSKQNNKTSSKDAPAKAKEGPKLLGQSCLYQIKKFGLYQYQIIKIDPVTLLESNVGPANVYAVVASALVDQIFYDINPGHK
ncbi:MAG: hypothetical protein NVS3B3_06700 [Aquirhabdus sp.]